MTTVPQGEPSRSAVHRVAPKVDHSGKFSNKTKGRVGTGILSSIKTFKPQAFFTSRLRPWGGSRFPSLLGTFVTFVTSQPQRPLSLQGLIFTRLVGNGQGMGWNVLLLGTFSLGSTFDVQDFQMFQPFKKLKNSKLFKSSKFSKFIGSQNLN